MEQNKSKTTTKTTYLARPRLSSISTTTSTSIPVLPTGKAVAVAAITPVTTTSTSTMSYSSHNHRPLSPGGRRIHNAHRMSDQGLPDHYSSSSSSRHPPTNSYANPRNSAGVIPISTQTFINVPPPTSSRPVTQYDSYSGRPRRSSLVDTQRGAVGNSTTSAPRIRPNIIQNDVARPASPIKIPREKDYYVTPAVTQEPRGTHKKLYSVDDTGAKLVADVNVPAGGERHHKRRDSVERSSNYRSTGVDRERDRGRRGYHTNGTANRPRDKSIDDEDAYSYTDPASMYRDTEPRWREVRPRRGSMDRGGATSRERPVSVLDPTFGLRQPAKDVGPPPSTRGWDKINENLGRTRSVRDEPSTRQHIAQSPTRGRAYAEPVSYVDARDPYYVAPRTNSTDRRTTVHQYDYGYEEPKEVRRGRKHSVTRDGRPDQSVERRGFGLRTDLRGEGHNRTDSQNRYARDGRGSDESFDAQKYRDSAYVEPHRRDTAPEPYQHEVLRAEQEKKDREFALRTQAEERDRHRERDVPREKRRDDDRTGYDREYDRSKRDRSREREIERESQREKEREREREREKEREKDREREREREKDRVRVVDPPADRERERHHHRRDTDRDRDYKKDNSPRQSSDTISKPSLSQAATGGLAGAAAAFGLTGLLNKVTDNKRDKDRDETKDRERERERDKERDRDRERDRERERKDRRENDDDRTERRKADDRDRSPHRERRPGKAASDDEPRERDLDRERQRDTDRGLGFAFETPEPPRSAPPGNNQDWKPDRMRDDRGADKRDALPQQERVADKPLEKRATFDQPERQSTADRQPAYAQDRDADRDREYEGKTAEMPAPAIDADEDYRRRMEQVQRELGVQRDALRNSDERGSDSDPERARRRREREQRQRERESRNGGGAAAIAGATDLSHSAELPPRRSLDRDNDTASSVIPDTKQPALRRRPSVLDQPMSMNDPVQIIDNSQSEKRENRVRIVDPPTELEEERRPKGILKRPTQKFPEDPNNIREGVAPLKDATKKGIPPGARWTKIDRRLVNPEALEAAQERFEERLDCVIVLRVLTKEEIQKLADKTRGIRDQRYEAERAERKSSRRPSRSRRSERNERDEYSEDDSTDEFKPKTPKALEAPPASSSSGTADFVGERTRREREKEESYVGASAGERRDRERERERETRWEDEEISGGRGRY